MPDKFEGNAGKTILPGYNFTNLRMNKPNLHSPVVLNRTISIHCLSPTPIGPVWIAVSEQGLVAVEIGGGREDFVRGLTRRGFHQIQDDPERASNAARQIEEYLAGDRRDFDLPIDWSGMSPFQVDMLRRVLAVPYGQVTTYGEIARQIGRPRASRAVGRANAANPLPLVIPCHRLVGSDGRLHGYGAPGGLSTKAWLLELEGVEPGKGTWKPEPPAV
jgi:methylated-DNA-[protein]-cysteine S-methyltransferase